MNKSTQTARKIGTLRPPAVRKQTVARKHTAAPFVDKIPLIRSLILDSVKPGVIKKIYLFGSYAYGKPTKNSDVDLCVVINNRFNRSAQYLKMALSLSDNNIRPVDLLVYKENQFYPITNPNGVKNTILTEGKLLYG
ncbi:MAG: nucleotidyltransferase domain-containing protein [Treponema sp.]|jgi:predicted nucleotidyltransferase|nr:nucleotidyltransferase domain-containing protein [Treponema sp.]